MNDGAAATSCSEVPTACILPFVLLESRTTYTSCTNVGTDGTGKRGYYWCPTAVDGNGHWVGGSTERCDGCAAAQAYSSAVSVAPSADNTDTKGVYAVDLDQDGTRAPC